MRRRAASAYAPVARSREPSYAIRADSGRDPEDFATRDDPARADAYRDAWMAYAQAIAAGRGLVAAGLG